MEILLQTAWSGRIGFWPARSRLFQCVIHFDLALFLEKPRDDLNRHSDCNVHLGDRLAEPGQKAASFGQVDDTDRERYDIFEAGRGR